MPIAWRGLGLAGTIVLCLASQVLAQTSVPPLEIPSGSGPAPEAAADVPARERIERAAQELDRRGYPELPLLALALLSESSDPRALERAATLAPHVPALRIELAWQRRSVSDLGAALIGMLSSVPCLSWLAAIFSGAVVSAIGVTAAAIALFAFGRSVRLHLHALGHRVDRSFASAAGLAIFSLVCLLPLTGCGVAVSLALLGLLGALRLAPRAGVACGAALVLAALALGPGIDVWSRLVAGPASDPALWAAWRMERAQPLPGDVALLERAVHEHPTDLVYKLALATHFKRIGDLERAHAQVAAIPPAADPVLQQRALNLDGILALATGDLSTALARFDKARSFGESAAILYNLSQAYARNMELEKRESVFSIARNLDPELVSHHAANSGSNVHAYLIQEPVPLGILLRRVLQQSEDAAAFGDELRERFLGPLLPAWSWIALAALALVTVWARLPGLVRCRRCDRPVCGRCAPAAAVAETCVRCERLFSNRGRVEARVRREQAQLDRSLQRRLRLLRAGLSVLIPGLGSWIVGRPVLGWLRIFACAVALCIPLIAAQLPVPFEAGRLGQVLPLALGLGGASVLYTWALFEGYAWLSGKRS